MPYIKKYLEFASSIKANEFLHKNGFSVQQAQKIIDKKMLYVGENIVEKKKEILNGKIYLIEYLCESRGLNAIFETQEFAIFDKPSGVLSHPNGRNCKYNMCDEIWHLYGKKAAVAHRLDKETSGILMVSKNYETQNSIKTMFEQQKVTKSYMALVYGRIDSNLTIDVPIGNSLDDEVRIRMQIRDSGKRSVTEIYPIEYFADLDMTLVRACPKTGRQHQIRVHLFHVKHKIVGDPLYGIYTDVVEMIMDEKLTRCERIKETGASRLCLHADEISFKFGENFYSISSKINARVEFLKAIN